MTLKEQALRLVEEMPEDSPRLREICDQLAVDKAIDEALADVRAGRVLPAEQAIQELRDRWRKRPLQSS